MSESLDESQLVPELGDLLTIVSDVYRSTTGRIIYRDGALIRIRPYTVSDRAVEFPLDESGMFQESLGVKELIIHEKAKYPQYAKQLGVLPGETLEFYTVDGTQSADPGIVKAVIADDTQDAIQLEDGRILEFGFIGPQPPFAVIIPRSPPEDFGSIDNNTDITEVEQEPEFPEFELPLALVEEIPTSERSYSDSVQREDMFVSMLLDVPQARQKNPRLLRTLYRTTDLLLALKNSVVVRDETNGVVADQHRSYVPTSLSQVLELQSTPVPAFLPVADVKKVVYTDDDGGEFEDVDVRPDVYSLLEASATTAAFKTGSEMGNPFLSYMDFLLRRNLPSFVPRSQNPTQWIQQDQDVLRSRVPPEAVQGFPSGLPAGVGSRRDEETTQLTVEYLGSVEDRSARLLAASQFLDRKTGQTFQVAPADPATMVDHVVLSTDLLPYRAPTRSAVLLWDIGASETSRMRTHTFYQMLTKSWDKQRVLSRSTASIPELLQERIGSALQIMDRPIVHTLDTLGMRTLELDSAMMEVLSKALIAGQDAWTKAMDKLRRRALASLESTDVAPIAPPIGDSDLWSETVVEQPDIAAALSDLESRETVLFPTSIARTSYFLGKANGTLLDLWYAVAGQHAVDIAASTYQAEMRRLQRRESNERRKEAELSSTLVKNECPHVYLLESIRGIREDSKKWVVFQDFLNKYQAGLRGNWVICGSCSQNLVCRHELMLLHEYQHPGRSVALHKSLLLEFSGPVFEGAYICKNCGQKIAEIEYDSHLEFDDEGRPLVGRTVVEPTTKVVKNEAGEDVEIEVEEGELDLAVAMKDEAFAKDNQGFSGADAKLYYLVRTVLEHCGITPTPELYQRMVSAIRDFQQYKIPPKPIFIAQKKKMDPKANSKTDYDKLYDEFYSKMLLGALGALAVLEIQTTNPPIPFPAHACPLSRTGYPLEKEGAGTLAYVACVIAGILRNDAPWNLPIWSRETSLPKRQAAVLADIRQSMMLVLAVPGPSGKAPPPLTTWTDYYQTALESTRKVEESKGIAEDSAAFIRADRIPTSFRPLPLLAASEEESAVRNASKLMSDVAEGDIQEVKEFLSKRQGDVLRTTLKTFHTSGQESAKSLGFLSETNPRSEGTCCFKRLGVVAAQGVGFVSIAEALGENKAEEVVLLEEGAASLRRRDPVGPANGTRLYVPWSATPTAPFQPAADSSMYYRLFLKNCFHGDNMGNPHEFGEDFVCRRCAYQLPKEFEYLTPSNLGISDGKKFAKAWDEMQETRRTMAMQSLQGIVSEETFHALEDAIHTRKIVYPHEYAGPNPLPEILEAYRQILLRIPVFSSAVQEWTILQQVSTKILANKVYESSERNIMFRHFSTAVDSLAERIELRMRELLGSRPTEINITAIQNAMEGLKKLTADSDGALNARNLLHMFVVPSSQMIHGYMNEKLFITRWFPSVAPSHKKLLQDIWSKHNAILQKGIDSFAGLSSVAQDAGRKALQSCTTWLGEWMQSWIQEMRPTSSYTGFTGGETAIILQWTVYTAISTLLFENSPLYTEVSPDIQQPLQRFFQSWCVSLLQLSAAESQKYQLSAKKIQDELLSRQEREKAYFIKRFDDLDRDMRKVELIKKRLKIGDWAVGTMKNLFQYDADFFEFERGQRAGMGLPEFDGDITGIVGAGAENPFGFMQFGVEAPAVGVNDHRVQQDEDAN